ncbi:MAG: phosphatidylserine decarboxylase 1 [Bathelium mastoideum]|nr:MAG: phosphatidylserine decarboxylase 1 [Bathelium mastoideum]
MSTLPLKFLSRLWGKFNEIELPYYLRVPGFKLYSWIFGVNLSEVAEPDLHVYPNLAAFFYRQLKPGCRPLDPNLDAVLSPADGKIIQYGMIEHGEVEQVKGVRYSLDALLGSQQPSESSSYTTTSNIASSSKSPKPSAFRTRNPSKDEEVILTDEEFAQVNGISYTLPHLFSGGKTHPDSTQQGLPTDQSTSSKPSSESEVRADLALASSSRPWWAPAPSPIPKALYYCVIYLAPGDYHRFHSPVSWVVQSRRHFAGELYSVSPYLQRTLPGLFVLNERVVLLGRWRHGFFSYTPVGATNVGSIKINFDKELQTNSLTTDTEADRQAERAKERGEPYSGFAEAYYGAASKVLGGHALKRGEEMGGFQLGSTIVLVFEAPKGRRRRSFDEGYSDNEDEKLLGGWTWNIDIGQKVKVGQALGMVDPEE